jgi:hypothetical protein
MNTAVKFFHAVGQCCRGHSGPHLELLLLHYADEEQLAATMESMLLGTPEGQAAL